MDVPKLITLVENYPEVYNLRHPEYFNSVRGGNIWEEIGAILNQLGSTCKDRWMKVRDNHRKALQRRKTTSGQAASHKRTPKYDKELTFLVPYLTDEENRQSNFTPSSQSHIEGDEQDSNEVSESEIATSPAQSSSSLTPISTITSVSKQFPVRKRGRTEPHKSAASVLQEYLSARANQTSGNVQTNEHDTLTNFFVNMAQTVKTFPERDQLFIKRKVFELVNGVEMQIAIQRAEPSTQLPHAIVRSRHNSPAPLVFQTTPNRDELRAAQTFHQSARRQQTVEEPTPSRINKHSVTEDLFQESIYNYGQSTDHEDVTGGDHGHNYSFLMKLN